MDAGGVAQDAVVGFEFARCAVVGLGRRCGVAKAACGGLAVFLVFYALVGFEILVRFQKRAKHLAMRVHRCACQSTWDACFKTTQHFGARDLCRVWEIQSTYSVMC